jgi:hypothetical protein
MTHENLTKLRKDLKKEEIYIYCNKTKQNKFIGKYEYDAIDREFNSLLIDEEIAKGRVTTCDAALEPQIYFELVRDLDLAREAIKQFIDKNKVN